MTVTFKVEIIKADKSSYWYAKHIGETFLVKDVEDFTDKYRVYGNEENRLIDKDDVVRVYVNEEEEEEQTEECPEIGDFIVFSEDMLDTTSGVMYEVKAVVEGDVIYTDDEGDLHGWGYPSEDYTLVKRKTSDELVANLAQEVAGIKRNLAKLKAEVSDYKTKNDVNNMAVAFDLDAIKNRLKEDK